MNLHLAAPAGMKGSIALPASKSVSNRALLIDSLCPTRGTLHNVAMCDDSDAMMRALDSDEALIDIGAAGTAMRFVTAYYATRTGHEVTLDGSPRMRQRPIGVLVDALRQLGAHIDYCGIEGFPPLHIVGKKLHPAAITMQAGVSSQYISAIAMIMPVTGGGSITLEGDIVSRPYIDMTLQLMRRYGATTSWENNVISVAAGGYRGIDFTIESDWSAASYWYALAALLPGSELRLEGLQHDSLQGDSAIMHMMAPLGVRTEWTSTGVRLTSTPTCNCPAHLDMTATPDLAQTMAVTLCLLDRPFRLTGLRSLRIKETDRLEGLRSQLARLGYALTIEGDDALSWNRAHCTALPSPVTIDTLDDHRMAMAMSLAAVKHDIIVADAQVVSKSYPAYWQHLQQAGFNINTIA